MLKLPSAEISYWRSTSDQVNYPRLREDKEVDVAIVGGGLSGLNTAYLLKQAGLRVAVLEKDSIGSGTSGHTTGKVTSQHNIIYDKMIRQLGDKDAQIYATANQAALDQIEKIIKDEAIDCGWTMEHSYVFTTSPDRVSQFKKEAKSAALLGLPATFETKTPLPFTVKATVKFSRQAKLNAQQYMNALADIIDGEGSYIFEKSRVLSIHDGDPCTVGTSRGTVYAHYIVIATNVPTLPLVARGAYCLMEYPHTSYIVAARTNYALPGMYISPDKGHYSILPVTNGKEKLILIGGENHLSGLVAPLPRYRKLAEYAEVKFNASSIEYRWKARDYMAYDTIPLIGKVYPWSQYLYTATAFRKWGLTNTMVAAIILRDLIIGEKNDWAGTFNSLRWRSVAAIPKIIAESLNLTKPFH
jgi:glycine/D-amino acid oxidase-like deaminating enzyme